jgi:hypothetical protein
MSQPAGCMAGSISLRRDQYACDGGISYTSGSLARELFTRFHVGDRSVRELRVCDGATEGEVKGSFQEMIRTRFELLWCRACLTSTVGISVSSMSPNLAGETSMECERSSGCQNSVAAPACASIYPMDKPVLVRIGSCLVNPLAVLRVGEWTDVVLIHIPEVLRFA